MMPITTSNPKPIRISGLVFGPDKNRTCEKRKKEKIDPARMKELRPCVSIFNIEDNYVYVSFKGRKLFEGSNELVLRGVTDYHTN